MDLPLADTQDHGAEAAPVWTANETSARRGTPAVTSASQNKVRIAYLVSAYPAVSHTFILREVNGLKKQNFEISVVSINSPDRPVESMTDDEREAAHSTFFVKGQGLRGAAGAHIITLLTSPRTYLRGLWFALKLARTDLRRLIFAFLYFTEALIIGRWMHTRRLRQIHVHFANAAATVGLIATHIFPIELSISVHGPDEFYDAPGFCLTEKIAGSKFIRCIGNFARSQLMKLSPVTDWSKFEVARLGVDPRQFPSRPLRPNPECFELLCVGRLVPAKGQHILVEAVARLVKSVPNLRMRLVGDGPDRKSLERAIADANLGRHVFIEGSISQDRIRDYYRGADLFVLPSFAEGIPVVLMEAMSMEVPCISTFVAGIPELIRNEVDGLLVSPSDDRELAAAIKRLIDDPQLRQRLGVAGRQRVIEKFNLESNLQHLARIFTSRIAETSCIETFSASPQQ